MAGINLNSTIRLLLTAAGAIGETKRSAATSCFTSGKLSYADSFG